MEGKKRRGIHTEFSKIFSKLKEKRKKGY